MTDQLPPSVYLAARLAIRNGTAPDALHAAAYAAGAVTRTGRPTHRGAALARSQAAQRLHLCTRCEGAAVETDSTLPSGEELCDRCIVRLEREVAECRGAFKWE